MIKIKADKFLTEITLKLDFFGYIRDIINSIYVNDTLIAKIDFNDILAFIQKFVLLYLNVMSFKNDFPILNGILEKYFNFKVIVDSLR